MNAPNQEHEKIERLLKHAKLSEPSPQLKGRVIETARAAWRDLAPDVPWQVPLCRLALSAAAAVVLISAANYFSDRVIAQALPDRPAVVDEETPDLTTSLGLPEDSLSRHWVRAGSPASSLDIHSVKAYIDTVRRMLDEAQQQEPSAPLPSTNGRSQESLSRFRFGSWS